MNEKPKRKRQNPQGRFAKGISGNPAGRPIGSRNQSTLFLEELLDGEGEALTRKAVELALEGDTMALRLCLERLLPVRKDRRIRFDVPSVAEVRDAKTAMASILVAVGEGQITPAEGEILTTIVEAQTRIIAAADFERRVSELERVIQNRQPNPPMTTGRPIGEMPLAPS